MNIAVLAACLPLATDPAAPALVLPLAAERMALEDNGMLSVIVHEADERADLNGDGDLEDQVAYLVTPGTWEVMNVGLAVDPGFPMLEASATHAVLAVPEEQMGSDANGDGDVSDHVYHVVDLATGETASLGLAAFFPLGHAELAADHVLVHAHESSQGASDLNGDGDAADIVLHKLDYEGNAVSPAQAINIPTATEATGPKVTLGLAFEFTQGAADLNGDGDLADGVLHVMPAGGAWLNTGAACDWVVQGSDLDPWLEPFALVGISESEQGVDFTWTATPSTRFRSASTSSPVRSSSRLSGSRGA